jgi:hypothetical protein
MRWVIVAILCWPGIAAAQDWNSFEGTGTAEYEARYVHALDETRGLGLAGIRARGHLGGEVVGYRVGIDLHAGATVPGGFAYDCALYPMGLGVRLGRWSTLGVISGVVAAGATHTMDDAVLLPAELSLDLALGSRLRVIARGRLGWVGAAPSRQDGAPTTPFADELDASFSIRWGDRADRYGFTSGRGYYLGVAYREAEGSRFVGVVVGHSIDAGTR